MKTADKYYTENATPILGIDDDYYKEGIVQMMKGYSEIKNKELIEILLEVQNNLAPSQFQLKNQISEVIKRNS